MEKKLVLVYPEDIGKIMYGIFNKSEVNEILDENIIGEGHREEKFAEFRRTKQVFYAESEWFQKGFGGKVYLGNSEAEALDKFQEDMDKRESAFFGFVRNFVTA